MLRILQMNVLKFEVNILQYYAVLTRINFRLTLEANMDFVYSRKIIDIHFIYMYIYIYFFFYVKTYYSIASFLFGILSQGFNFLIFRF